MDSVPFLVSWNLTKRCNLKCAHCYLDAGELEGAADITTIRAKSVIDEILGLSPAAMLILTGGEPLLRSDIYEISGYASNLGLTVVVGTNGALLDDTIVKKLKDSGVKGVGVSVDSPTPAYHDRFRGLSGAWEKTMNGLDALRSAGLDFQIQFTVTKENRGGLRAIIELAHKKGARAINIFFLVCTGRGQNVTDLTPSEYEAVLAEIVTAASEYDGRIMVRARCAPHLVRVAGLADPDGPLSKGFTSGCIAGTGYLRITPEGRVTPCPYIPVTASTPEINTKSLKDIWESGAEFVKLRSKEYHGRCFDCEFIETCGGCRARSLAANKDLMGEDPWCEYVPRGRQAGTQEPVWTKEAEARLQQAPAFIRPMIKKGLEAYAKKKGLKEITVEVMAELRKRAGR